MIGIEIREIISTDIETICQWWHDWNGIYLEQEELAKNGFIASYEGEPIAAAFLYLPFNSSIANIGFPVTTKSRLPWGVRREALRVVLAYCKKEALRLGCVRIISMTDRHGIAAMLKGAGFSDIPHHSFMAYGITDP